MAAVSRHGKWIVVSFGDDPVRLGIHLRMSGQLLRREPGRPPDDRHVHAVLTFEDDVAVWFRDPRTFGELRLLPDGAPVAPDLFDPAVTGASLTSSAAGRRVGVKAVLLDQTLAVSGIGSYLGDEALHRARIDPRRAAGSLATSAWERILAGARSVTEESTAAGGVTLPDEGWIDLDGRRGGYADALRVHGRTTCATCGVATRRAVVGGRSARWCPTCQHHARRS